MNLLLVEDHQELANLLQAFLKKRGFSLWHALSAEQALCILQEQDIDLILLDIMLPAMDGFAFCQVVRKISSIPILMMSARSSKQDKLSGYELGADDYLEKPVDMDLLYAKINVLLHRQHKQSETIIQSGALHIDQAARKVYVQGALIDVNVKEYELLILLVKNAGKTLQKEYLFNQIWGADSESESQTLTVHIQMLRAKIEVDKRRPQRIQTVWGVGYRYEAI